MNNISITFVNASEEAVVSRSLVTNFILARISQDGKVTVAVVPSARFDLNDALSIPIEVKEYKV